MCGSRGGAVSRITQLGACWNPYIKTDVVGEQGGFLVNDRRFQAVCREYTLVVARIWRGCSCPAPCVSAVCSAGVRTPCDGWGIVDLVYGCSVCVNQFQRTTVRVHLERNLLVGFSTEIAVRAVVVEPQTCKSVAFEQSVPHVQNLFLNDTVSVGMTYSGFVKRMQCRGCVV